MGLTASGIEGLEDNAASPKLEKLLLGSDVHSLSNCYRQWRGRQRTRMNRDDSHQRIVKRLNLGDHIEQQPVPISAEVDS